MRSSKMKHLKYQCTDQPMSNRGYGAWRKRAVRHTHTYYSYTDSGEFFKGTRIIFKAKVKS